MPSIFITCSFPDFVKGKHNIAHFPGGSQSLFLYGFVLIRTYVIQYTLEESYHNKTFILNVLCTVNETLARL